MNTGTIVDLRLPELSENGGETVITAWHVTQNGYVVKDQDLLEVATDKATFDVPSPCAGVLIKILKKEGEEVRAGEIIARIKVDRS
ncbi:MAG: lipoyl domain-containing protein [Candidatus Omnitrophota bacterium]|nr:lipoyl domain-containing protein [Candidatus Omnitrophota bacterium]